MPSSPMSELTANDAQHGYDQRTVVGRELARTPSPTPSEQRVLEDDGKIDIRRILRRTFQKQNWSACRRQRWSPLLRGLTTRL